MNGPLHGCLKYQIDLGYHFMIVAEAYLQFSTRLSTKFQLHLVSFLVNNIFTELNSLVLPQESQIFLT